MQEVLNILEPLARASLDELFVSSSNVEKPLQFEERDSKVHVENHESSYALIQVEKCATEESSESSSDGCGDTKYIDSLVTARQVPR